MIEKHPAALRATGTDHEILVRAEEMLSQHGDNAVVLACMMADAELIRGRMNDYETCKRVASAIEGLLKRKPDANRVRQ